MSDRRDVFPSTQNCAMCCSVLQCVAVCCSVLQYVAECCTVLQSAVECRSVLQSVAVCCRVLQSVAECCSVLQCVALCCSVLHCVAVSRLYSLSYLRHALVPLCFSVGTSEKERGVGGEGVEVLMIEVLMS